MKKDPHIPTKPKLWLARHIVKNFVYRDGDIYYKNSPTAKVGSVDYSNGYVRTQIKGRRVAIHHIVWFLNKRYWPRQQLDHIDRNRQNNKIENLREVTTAENQKNSNIANKTNFKGAYQVSLNTFQSQIWFRRKRYCLGSFSSAEEAHEAFKKKYKELHGVDY